MSSPSWMKRIERGFGAAPPMFAARSKAAGLIGDMSNWQNHQWMRAGSPRSLKDLKRFAAMVHP